MYTYNFYSMSIESKWSFSYFSKGIDFISCICRQRGWKLLSVWNLFQWPATANGLFLCLLLFNYKLNINYLLIEFVYICAKCLSLNILTNICILPCHEHNKLFFRIEKLPWSFFANSRSLKRKIFNFTVSTVSTFSLKKLSKQFTKL